MKDRGHNLLGTSIIYSPIFTCSIDKGRHKQNALGRQKKRRNPYTAHGAQITPSPLFFSCFYAYLRLG